MQIHELTTAQSVGTNEYIAIDNGTTTRKYNWRDGSPVKVTFTSSDQSTPTAWKTMTTFVSDRLDTLMSTISKAISNVRYLYSLIGTTSMGTSASTITGAIAEHNTKIATDEETLAGHTASIDAIDTTMTEMFKSQTGTYTYSISASGNLNITLANLGISTPSGYTPIALTQIATGSTSVMIRTYNAAPDVLGGTAVLALKNATSSALSNLTATATILYVKSSLF